MHLDGGRPDYLLVFLQRHESPGEAAMPEILIFDRVLDGRRLMSVICTTLPDFSMNINPETGRKTGESPVSSSHPTRVVSSPPACQTSAVIIRWYKYWQGLFPRSLRLRGWKCASQTIAWPLPVPVSLWVHTAGLLGSHSVQTPVSLMCSQGLSHPSLLH